MTEEKELKDITLQRTIITVSKRTTPEQLKQFLRADIMKKNKGRYQTSFLTSVENPLRKREQPKLRLQNHYKKVPYVKSYLSLYRTFQLFTG
jgi:hypothetical protein